MENCTAEQGGAIYNTTSSTLNIYGNTKFAISGRTLLYKKVKREWKYVYKIYMSRDQIINTLKNTTDIDELSCDFDFERSTIKFSEYGSQKEYYFQIQECDGISILRLEQVALLGMQSNIPLKLNPFLVSKLQAEIIPFSLYGF